jgi:hypothetical protein
MESKKTTEYLKTATHIWHPGSLKMGPLLFYKMVPSYATDVPSVPWCLTCYLPSQSPKEWSLKIISKMTLKHLSLTSLFFTLSLTVKYPNKCCIAIPLAVHTVYNVYITCYNGGNWGKGLVREHPSCHIQIYILVKLSNVSHSRSGFNTDVLAVMYESNPTAISPPPGNPRAFDLTLPPYRREFDGPVGNLTARPGIWPLDNNLLSSFP